MTAVDAVVVGSGPNGLAAALTLARSGLRVEVLEAAATPGGGCRTEALTLPGFRHDVCSSVHPLAAGSPFFLGTDLAGHGVKLLYPKVAFAHPLDGGRAAAVTASVADTAAALGRDAAAYRRLLGPLVRRRADIMPALLAPLRGLPEYTPALVRFGARGILPASVLARWFRTDEARGLLAGVAAHAMLPLTDLATGGFGLVLAMLAHSPGWPLVEGGSGEIVRALTEELAELGGQVVCGEEVRKLGQLPPARITMFDTSPRQFLAIAGDELPPSYRRALGRFRYGPGVFKVDWALSGPVPWAAAACRDAGTVHLGGTFAEVAAGRHPDRPYTLIAQAGVVDPTRAPAGQHTLWGYCHVPAGSDRDMTGAIESQVERFAPGFRDLILARSVRTAAGYEAYNANYVGGDINAGAGTFWQTLARPVPRWNPYRTALAGVYLCSASTSPGGGVHGMCGASAARTALADLGLSVESDNGRGRP